jgi:hypothetical protein
MSRRCNTYVRVYAGVAPDDGTCRVENGIEDERDRWEERERRSASLTVGRRSSSRSRCTPANHTAKDPCACLRQINQRLSLSQRPNERTNGERVLKHCLLMNMSRLAIHWQADHTASGLSLQSHATTTKWTPREYASKSNEQNALPSRISAILLPTSLARLRCRPRGAKLM